MLNLSLLFNEKWYLEKYPDVAAAVESGHVEAFQHYALHGVNESRAPGPLFDAELYLARNPDVEAAVSDGLFSSAAEHFLMYGQYEYRDHSPEIHLPSYLEANQDVAAAVKEGLSPLVHLMQYGIYEGRDLGNGINLSSFSDDPIFRSALDMGDSAAALRHVIEFSSIGPAPEPQPDPQPDPQSDLGGVQVSITPDVWKASSNEVKYSLQFDSAIELKDISIGNGTLSTTRESFTTGGVTVVDVKMSANTGSSSGSIMLDFSLPEDSAAYSLSIMSFTLNGVTYEDVLHPINSMYGVSQQYGNLSILNTEIDPAIWDRNTDIDWPWDTGWDDGFWMSADESVGTMIEMVAVPSENVFEII